MAQHSGLIRPYHSAIATFQRVVDLGLIWLSLVLSAHIYGLNWSFLYDVVGIIGMVVYSVAASQFRVYRSWRGRNLVSEIVEVAKCWGCIMFIFLLLAFATKVSAYFSRQVLILWWIFGYTAHIALRGGLRTALNYLRSTGRNIRTAVVAGAGDTGQELVSQIISEPWTGINISGFYDDERAKGERPIGGQGPAVLGRLDDLQSDIRARNYDMVFVALPIHEQNKVKTLVDHLHDHAAEVHIVPDIFMFDLINSKVREISGVPIISVYGSPMDDIGRFLKRMEDLTLATFSVLLAAIPMLLISLGIKLTSPGPVLFKQRRFGLTGRDIVVWKFRTMGVCEDGAQIKQAKANDDRVTTFGRFLRRTSLDELPQLFNVLAGSMSVVGPRPHAAAHNEQYSTEIAGYMQRHLVKPGITGWAQVNGWRGETDTREKMEKRVEHDMFYIKRWSLWFDAKIILLTLTRGFVNKNAY